MPKDDKWHKLNFKENQNKGTFKQQKQKRREKNVGRREKKRSIQNNRIRKNDNKTNHRRKGFRKQK